MAKKTFILKRKTEPAAKLREPSLRNEVFRNRIVKATIFKNEEEEVFKLDENIDQIPLMKIS